MAAACGPLPSISAMSSAFQSWSWSHKSPLPVRSYSPPPITKDDPLPQPAMLPLSFFGHVEPQRPWTAHVAEKTCEMLCYLWFSDGIGATSRTSPRGRQQRRHQPTASPSSPFPVTNTTTALLQFNPKRDFVKFVHNLLQTTQVSQSVIVLSLHFIYRLKARCAAHPHPGSEYRVVVAGLMMANKFVDDNTYTNKTWADVSGIPLAEINSMEREFLTGVEYRLYVDKATYESWLNLLKGLVLAMDRDCQQWQYWRRQAHKYTPANPPLQQPFPRLPSHPPSSQHTQRARSTSPRSSTRSPYPFTFAPPPVPSHQANPFTPYRSRLPHEPAQLTPSPQARKRAAMDAFSPDSFAPTHLHPNKRPVSMDVAHLVHRDDGHMMSYEPSRRCPEHRTSISLEPLASFARLSIDNKQQTPPRPNKHQTLVAPYCHDQTKMTSVPANLYFYTLASSPMDVMDNVRKARLRSHPPPPYATPAFTPLPPLMIQSANTSPRDIMMNLDIPAPRSSYPTRILPSTEFDDPSAWRDRASQGVVPSAPFANNGPPGLQWSARQQIETFYQSQRQFQQQPWSGR